MKALQRGLILFCLLFALSACSGSSAAGGGTATPTPSPTINPSAAVALSIDNAGTLPIFGSASTSSVIYIHNNSSQALSGITYTAEENNLQESGPAVTSIFQRILRLLRPTTLTVLSTSFIDPNSAAQCATIAANSSCPLGITTPANLGTALQGSALLTASYSLNGNAQSFSNLINYAVIQNNPSSGALFASGATISSFGNASGYATLYLYGSGQGQVYTVTNLSSDKPGLSIVQGNIVGQQLQSNFVQAVEISALALATTVTANLNVTSNSTSSSFVNSSSVAVAASASQTALNASLIPTLDSSVANPAGQLYLSNTGNVTLNLGAATATAGISNLSASCVNNQLAVGASCVLNFNVTQLSGTGTISVPFTSSAGSTASPVVLNVNWINGIGSAALQLAASNNPVAFAASQTANSLITVTNVGGYLLSGISLVAPVTVSGSAVAQLVSDASDSCSNQSLDVGSSCQFQVQLAASSTTNGQIALGVAANSVLGSYTTSLALNYTVSPFAAQLTMQPSQLSLSISGNGFQTQSQLVTLSNSGAAPAIISAVTWVAAPTFLTESSTTCVTPLASGGSCLINLVLGPTHSAVAESGSASLQISYSGGTTTAGAVATESVIYQVLPSSLALNITAVTANNAFAGNGESLLNSYVFVGSNSAAKSITLTVQNNGLDSIQISGIQDSNSNYAWLLNSTPSISSCYNVTPLTAGQSCSLVYNNVLAGTSGAFAGGLGSSYTENLQPPVITFSDLSSGGVYQLLPSLPSVFANQLIYAKATQATLTNSVVEYAAGSLSESVVVQHSLANAQGYSLLQVTTKMENYFASGTSVATGGCMTWSANGVTSQSCSLTPNLIGLDNESVTYWVNPSAVQGNTVSLDSLFSLIAGGQTVSMTPQATTTLLNIMP